MPQDQATYALRSHLQSKLHRELGARIGTIVLDALERGPFDQQRAVATDRAIDSLAQARRAAFASAGLPLPASVRIPERRHEALLKLCLELLQSKRMNTADRFGLRQEAEAMHDRVKAFLDRRGRWPILSLSEFEAHARPAARVIVEWDHSDE